MGMRLEDTIADRKLIRAMAYVVKSEGIIDAPRHEAPPRGARNARQAPLSSEAAFFEALEKAGLELRLKESCLFRDLTKSRLHRGFIIFNMSLWEDIFKIIACIFPCKHQDLYVRSLFPIHDATSTLFVEFCCSHI